MKHCLHNLAIKNYTNWKNTDYKAMKTKYFILTPKKLGIKCKIGNSHQNFSEKKYRLTGTYVQNNFYSRKTSSPSLSDPHLQLWVKSKGWRTRTWVRPP